MPIERRGPSHPFGMACVSCYKSKLKCIARQDGESCERCHRMQKQCHPSDIPRRGAGAPPAPPKKPSPTTQRITDLENKLNGLISQLKSLNVIDGEGTASRDQSGARSHFGDGNGFDGEAESVDSDDDTPMVVPPPADAREQGIPQSEETDRLDAFRSLMVPHFGLVYLPAIITPEVMRQHRPFLFRAILCVMSPLASEKVSRGRVLKTMIHHEVVRPEGELSLDVKMDLLLAILTYVSWGWNHVLKKGNLPRLMAYAQWLANGIRHTGQPIPGARMVELFDRGVGSMASNGGSRIYRSIDQQRALLGCFVLSSAMSAHYSHLQSEVLRWTPQMEEALAAVGSSKESPTDTVFALQVRLQLFAQKAAQIRLQHALEVGQAASTETVTLPALTALTALQRQVEDLQITVPLAIYQREVVIAHIHATKLIIGQATHAVRATVPVLFCQFGRGEMSGNGGHDATSRGERLQCLWQCTYAAQACAMALLSSSPAEFRGVAFVQWQQLTACCVAVDWLTATIEEPTWNRAAAQAVIGVPGLLSQIAAQLELVAQVAGELGPDEVFTSLARGMHEFSQREVGREEPTFQVVGDQEAGARGLWPRPVGTDHNESQW